MNVYPFDYCIRFVELPWKVHGVVLPNDDATFDIYINARLPEACRKKAVAHELEHIRQDHLYDARPVEELEAEAG